MFLPSNTPLIMGILNATPDSFYPPSRTISQKSAANCIDLMITSAPDIIDIGGESSRPGSLYISSDEEINRVLPVLQYIRERSSIPISIDTRKAEVAEKCINEGANIINDISALEDDKELAPLIASKDCYVVLMHKKGTPEMMQNNPEYRDIVNEIASYLDSRAAYALESGIKKEKIIIDPGFGFGKTLKDNLLLLKHIKRFKDSGYRVLVGISRKSMIGGILDIDVEKRLNGTIVANTYAALEGADIIRVHDVNEHIEMKKVIQAVLAAGEDHGAA